MAGPEAICGTEDHRVNSGLNRELLKVGKSETKFLH